MPQSLKGDRTGNLRELEAATALVIGYGSIGQRHRRVLSDLGLETWVVSRRSSNVPHVVPAPSEALEQAKPDYVVIASTTAEHHEDVSKLARLGFTGRVLLEKPMFNKPSRPSSGSFSSMHVANNLRFNPLLEAIRSMCGEDRLCSMQVYVGQYLPTWCPKTDYRTSYSAHPAQGGSVLHDISHELYYLLWILGDWRAVAASGGQVSDLEIDSDDVFTMLLATERCPMAALQMNNLDRVGRREITVNTTTRALRADLIANSLWVDGTETRLPTIDRDFTYRNMHLNVLCPTGATVACTEADGFSVMELIAAAEAASLGKVWKKI